MRMIGGKWKFYTSFSPAEERRGLQISIVFIIKRIEFSGDGKMQFRNITSREA